MADRIRGHVQRLTYHNPDNGYTIARIAPEDGGEAVTAVGVMVALSEGEMVEVEGTWVTHPRYGPQLEVVSYCPVVPSNREGIERFLAAGLLPGIGPVMAKRLVERFGEATLDIIDKKPRKLRRVPGLGKKRVAAIVSAWGEQRQARDVMVFLQSHGVGAGHAARVFRQYGTEAIQTVRQDPYRLERDVRGIGFPTADQIAAKLGMARDAPQRVQAGIRYLLSQGADKGHVYLPTEALLEGGRELLGVGAELLGPAADSLARDGGIISEDGRHYLPPLFRAEVAVAGLLLGLMPMEEGEDLPAPAVAESDEIQLGPDQQRAVAMAMANRVLVLTGGPGTGKTTVTRAILRQFQACGLTVHLCSPTGRAAQRLSEASGREARTIHRLLEFLPAEGRFRKDESDQLDVDALIVDEASMIDLQLMRSLLRALPAGARLILVGDVDQLPSVGPGHVMRDIIDSGRIPVVCLSEIYRQDRESQIITNAHRINRGEWPLAQNRRDGDFFIVEVEDPVAVAATVEDLCAQRLPAHGGYDPMGDIQVLTPMYRGETGANRLNQRLQRRLNPDQRGHEVGEREFRVGDRVLQVRNDYDKGVLNGDLGRVRYLSAEDQNLVVEFGASSRCTYGFGELDDLMLAYAISTHRSQGSEFPVVVLPLTTQHYVMLQRNLLYTAVTRARELLVVVGSLRALRRAVLNDEVARRHTTLAQRLRADGARPSEQASAASPTGSTGH